MYRWTRLSRAPLYLVFITTLAAVAIYRSWEYSARFLPNLFRAWKITSVLDLPENCPMNSFLPANPPVPLNLWASLTADEILDIHDWLFHPSRSLNLTVGRDASLSDNVIFQIESYRPPKGSVVKYLSAPTQRHPPERYAKVTIHHGARTVKDGGPTVKDYLVGPLPLYNDKKTIMRPLTEIYHRNDIPFNARAALAPAELAPFLASVMSPIASVTQVSCYCMS